MEATTSKAARTAQRRLLLATGFMLAVAGASAIAAPVVQKVGGPKSLDTAQIAPQALQPVLAEELVWRGVDVDGDGQADFANPTGKDTRKEDAYGHGEFGASRDGGSRRHEGVDFIADAGQSVAAPISGYVSKLGFAYADDANLKFVEITNPALRYTARIFYVDPEVEVGQAVQVGQRIGAHHTLERKYPGGMTDHVHLEIIDTRGARIDATRLITARYEPVRAPARG
ncbi:M23 family metallopeptidase [Phenylobacterium sp. LjRoot219]|uniref:M23 family metallopeptidase n=1 Tax=Phenylobacterium sp. LjRoot219 TaxID=3342283 RepID=UPI003ECCB580